MRRIIMIRAMTPMRAHTLAIPSSQTNANTKNASMLSNAMNAAIQPTTIEEAKTQSRKDNT